MLIFVYESNQTYSIYALYVFALYRLLDFVEALWRAVNYRRLTHLATAFQCNMILQLAS